MSRRHSSSFARFSTVPPWQETVALLRENPKPSVYDVLKQAQQDRKTLIQPRCGVGEHERMKQLLNLIEREGKPDILTLTIDSYTRLNQFDYASKILYTEPQKLNGYPLVSHGFSRGKELDQWVESPLQVRHGSPDARHLFEVALASRITSFEGGGIGYNIPYCKAVSIRDSLDYWRYVDAITGELAEQDVLIDREFFGTLTAVLVPPSVSLSITLLEAILSAKEGARCFSVSYPQGGALVQDIAALTTIRDLFPRFLPKGSHVFPVLHGYMGPFPVHYSDAEALIFLSAAIADLANAVKLVYKTCEEAIGIPSGRANCVAAAVSKKALGLGYCLTPYGHMLVREERQQIERELLEIVLPVLEYEDHYDAIFQSFLTGALDVPFSANEQVHSAIVPLRDPSGAIRYYDHGALPFSPETISWNQERLQTKIKKSDSLHTRLERDICFFQQKIRNEILECLDHTDQVSLKLVA